MSVGLPACTHLGHQSVGRGAEIAFSLDRRRSAVDQSNSLVSFPAAFDTFIIMGGEADVDEDVGGSGTDMDPLDTPSR